MSPVLVPVRAHVVRPEWATRVVSPAADAIGPHERRQLMAADPFVFLHVTRSPDDLDAPLSTEELLEHNAAALARFLASDVFGPLAEPAVYLYRLRTHGHEQTAVIGDIPLAAFTEGRLRPHERTRPRRARLLADHLARLQMTSSPVAAAYHARPDIRALVAEAEQAEPELAFERGDGLAQAVWRVPDEAAAELLRLLDQQDLYIVDGHHRVAAGLEYAARVGVTEGPATRVLGAVFPHDELRVYPFHRRLRDRNGLSASQLLDEINRVFDVEEVDNGAAPAADAPGTFAMYVDGRWFRLAGAAEPGRLDVSVLQQRVLGPVLGASESDPRLEYHAGTIGAEQLVEMCDNDGGVAFVLHPIGVEELMAVVDRGETMPPKSTYFAPKVRSGVFLVPRSPEAPWL